MNFARPASLLHPDQLLRSLFERIVVADDEQLLKAAHAHDLPGKRAAPRFVQICRRLVEEGDADIAHLLEQGQPYRQRRAHLLTAGQLRKFPLAAIHFQDDPVILLPAERARVVLHNLAE